MLIFGKYAEMIPMAALAAVLFQVAFNMCGYKNFIKLVKGAPKSDVTVLLVTFVLTVVMDLTIAIEVGVLLAAILFIRRMSDVAEVECVTQQLQETDEELADPNNIASRQVPQGVAVFEIMGSLFFGAVEKFKTALDMTSSHPKILILRMRQVPSIDAAGIQMIEGLLTKCRTQGTQLLLSGVHSQPIVALSKSGLLKDIGEQNVLANIDAALNRAREILGLPIVAAAPTTPSVDWERNVQQPWVPENANAKVAEETTEVIAETISETQAMDIPKILEKKDTFHSMMNKIFPWMKK